MRLLFHRTDEPFAYILLAGCISRYLIGFFEQPGQHETMISNQVHLPVTHA